MSPKLLRKLARVRNAQSMRAEYGRYQLWCIAHGRYWVTYAQYKEWQKGKTCPDYWIDALNADFNKWLADQLETLYNPKNVID